MEVKDFRGIAFKIFLFLLVATVVFHLYNLINPFDFPGLWQRLLSFDIGFGVLSFTLYFSEITSFLDKIKAEKPQGRNVMYKFEHKKPEVKKYYPRVHKFNFRKNVESLKSYKSLFVRFDEVSERSNLKLFLFIGGAVIYVLFLLWASKKLSFNQFLFFILLLYVPISLKFKLDTRYPIVVAMILSVVCGVVFVQGSGIYAERIAIYVYYCLAIGVGLMFIENFMENENNS